MKHLFTYKESEDFKISQISLIGDFNDWDAKANELVQVNPYEWAVEAEVPAGKYFYQFLVNGNLALNDPEANLYLVDSKKQLKSVIVINECNQRLYNNEQYQVNLVAYNLSGQIEDLNKSPQLSYTLGLDSEVILGMGFEKISGVHNLSVAWYKPEGKLCTVAEHPLYQPKDKKEARLWFKLQLKPHSEEGTWQVVIFIDGKFLHKESFIVKKEQYNIDEEKSLLPLGSVVKLKQSEARFMIFGTLQKNKQTNEVWDYIGCVYPEGHIGIRHTLLFNHEQIETIEFKGYKV